MAETPVNRGIYLDKLRDWREKRLIKVISGVQRCGKSTLLSLSFAEYLAFAGAGRDQAKAAFTDYLRFGSFPYVASLGRNAGLVKTYIDGIYNTILSGYGDPKHSALFRLTGYGPSPGKHCLPGTYPPG